MGVSDALPKMRAFLEAEVASASGEEAVAAPKGAATGDRAARVPPAAPRLDRLLATMAEGVLVGSTGGVHVRLQDAFFDGTELIIEIVDGAVVGILRPPTLATFRVLSEHRDALCRHLEGQGLRVSRFEVRKP